MRSPNFYTSREHSLLDEPFRRSYMLCVPLGCHDTLLQQYVLCILNITVMSAPNIGYIYILAILQCFPVNLYPWETKDSAMCLPCDCESTLLWLEEFYTQHNKMFICSTIFLTWHIACFTVTRTLVWSETILGTQSGPMGQENLVIKGFIPF